MKILVINWQDIRNPLAGGAEVQFQEVFSRVAAAGHAVTLFCSSFPGAPEEETFGGIRIVRQGGRALFNYTVPGAYRSRFSREGFDVVVDDMNKIPFFTPLFVREPLCGIVHHLFGSSIFREADPATASYVYSMERAALAYYRRRGVPFMVVSPSTMEDMRMLGFPAGQLHLVPLAVDHTLFRPTGVARSTTPLIGYVGRIKKYKSIDHLIEALPLVRNAGTNVKTLIVGEGDDRPRLEALVKELGLGDAVRFTGYVPEEEKVRLLQEMWCMVTTSSKEGWGLTVTEANACGTTVIASNVPGLRDAVRDGETGVLYPYGDREALAKSIIALLGDANRRERLAQQALAFAAQFTWDEAAHRTIALLSRLAAEGKRAVRTSVPIPPGA